MRCCNPVFSTPHNADREAESNASGFNRLSALREKLCQPISTVSRQISPREALEPIPDFEDVANELNIKREAFLRRYPNCLAFDEWQTTPSPVPLLTRDWRHFGQREDDANDKRGGWGEREIRAYDGGEEANDNDEDGDEGYYSDDENDDDDDDTDEGYSSDNLSLSHQGLDDSSLRRMFGEWIEGLLETAIAFHRDPTDHESSSSATAVGDRESDWVSTTGTSASGSADRESTTSSTLVGDEEVGWSSSSAAVSQSEPQYSRSNDEQGADWTSTAPISLSESQIAILEISAAQTDSEESDSTPTIEIFLSNPEDSWSNSSATFVNDDTSDESDEGIQATSYSFLDRDASSDARSQNSSSFTDSSASTLVNENPRDAPRLEYRSRESLPQERARRERFLTEFARRLIDRENGAEGLHGF